MTRIDRLLTRAHHATPGGLDKSDERSYRAGIVAKGAETRDRILDRAVSLASRDGLGGLTIGTLASELGLSKSGLFAHFGSKEDLQLEVLRAASARFVDAVLRPAFRAPRGEPRLRSLFEHWMRWATDPALPGGCILVAATAELDDHEGRPRDFLSATQRQLDETLTRSVRMAMEAGHFRADLDAEQLAFELHSIFLGYHHTKRLLRDPRAEKRGRVAFERLVADARA
jgi:AcrR family transcriptional regulator